MFAGMRLTTLLKVGLGASAFVLTVAVLAAPAPRTPPTEPLTDLEKVGLQRLHRSTVEIFIDRPGFGMRRMLLPLEDIVKSPKPTNPKDGPIADPLPERVNPEAKPKEAHFAVQDMVDKWGFGRVPTDDKKDQWKVKKVLLVGLTKNPKPVVYLTDKMPDMKDAKNVPTRELDQFEKTALESLRGGEDLKAEKRGKELRMMGPIYAGARCIKCHEKKGELLGAFTFELERVPVPPMNEAKTNPRVP